TEQRQVLGDVVQALAQHFSERAHGHLAVAVKLRPIAASSDARSPTSGVTATREECQRVCTPEWRCTNVACVTASSAHRQ
ncbi:MAG: hypothetical protein ACRDVF_18245, partial [Microbacterium sp.]|uniref:hypothetical protein n=1 Tax=Microbacterium sp. TaxID=51671 RepID=UPI003D6DD1FC